MKLCPVVIFERNDHTFSFSSTRIIKKYTKIHAKSHFFKYEKKWRRQQHLLYVSVIMADNVPFKFYSSVKIIF